MNIDQDQAHLEAFKLAGVWRKEHIVDFLSTLTNSNILGIKIKYDLKQNIYTGFMGVCAQHLVPFLINDNAHSIEFKIETLKEAGAQLMNHDSLREHFRKSPLARDIVNEHKKKYSDGMANISQEQMMAVFDNLMIKIVTQAQVLCDPYSNTIFVDRSFEQETVHKTASSHKKSM